MLQPRRGLQSFVENKKFKATSNFYDRLEKLLMESIIQTFWEKKMRPASVIKSRTDTAARQRYPT